MRNPRTWLGFAVSAAAIYFLFSSFDLSELGGRLAAANPWLVIACVATLPLAMWAKAYRWQWYFPRRADASLYGLNAALCIGYMANTVLPLRIGELVRAYVLSESERLPKATVIATILVEKVLDITTIALFLFVLRFILPFEPALDRIALLAGLGVAAVVVGIALLLAARDWMLGLIGRIEQRFGLVSKLHPVEILTPLIDGFQFARDPRLLAINVTLAIVTWFASGVTSHLGFGAVGIWVPYSVTMWVVVATNLGMVVPAAPGYVGVFHYTVVWALSQFGVDREAAGAAAIIIHAAVFGMFIVLGSYFALFGRQAGGGFGALIARAKASEASSVTDPRLSADR
ncbi:MAG: lysylphosphatidylglycerol synthase transmembrane domain-containing protein [Chloroflexota bacterium]